MDIFNFMLKDNLDLQNKTNGFAATIDLTKTAKTTDTSHDNITVHE